MKYLKRFNESHNTHHITGNTSEEDWDLEEIGDIFQDILDEGFTLDDVYIGNSLTLAPKLWGNSSHDFTEKSFPSLSITFKSKYEDPKYDLSILDVLDECIKHFESYYKLKLEIIFTVGIPTFDYSSGSRRTVIYNWFNSCETIKDINKVWNDELKVRAKSLTLHQSSKDDASSKIDKLTLDRFDLTFKLKDTI